MMQPRSGKAVCIVRNSAGGSSGHTHVPNCVRNARIGKLDMCRLRNQSVRGKFQRLFGTNVFAEGRVA